MKSTVKKAEKLMSHRLPQMPKIGKTTTTVEMPEMTTPRLKAMAKPQMPKTKK